MSTSHGHSRRSQAKQKRHISSTSSKFGRLTAVSAVASLMLVNGNSDAFVAHAFVLNPSKTSKPCLSTSTNLASFFERDDNGAFLAPDDRGGGSSFPSSFRERGGGLSRYEQERHSDFQDSLQGDSYRYDEIVPWHERNNHRIEGSSLKTWSTSPGVNRHAIDLRTDNGRPLHARVEYWDGPNNAPTQMQISSQDGSQHAFRALTEGRGTVSVRNTGPMEFPIQTRVRNRHAEDRFVDPYGMEYDDEEFTSAAQSRTVQGGGSLVTFPFDPSVSQIRLNLSTDGLPMSAKVELLQGSNNVKTVAELYNDGMNSYEPFAAVIDAMPGLGGIVQITNTGPLEYPIRARIAPLW